MKEKKKRYNIYALTVGDGSQFFYIGMTCHSIEYRLSMHMGTVKRGDDANIAKSEFFKKHEFDIRSVLLQTVVGLKKTALKKEKEAIDKYLQEGHPITNKIHSGQKSFKTIKVAPYVHLELKYYGAVKGENIFDIAGFAILEYLKKNGHDFIKTN